MPIRLQACFDQMRTAAAREPHPSFAQREQWLQNLQGILREHAEDFCGAIESDFGSRSAHETRLLEVLPSLQAIEFALRHLRHWMVPEVRKTHEWAKSAHPCKQDMDGTLFVSTGASGEPCCHSSSHTSARGIPG